MRVHLNDAGDADLARFARALRTRHVVGAGLGAMVRALCAMLLPGLATLWVRPSLWPWLVAAVAVALAVVAGLAAWRASARRDHLLLREAAVPGADAATLAEIGDELATWLERRPAGHAAMRAWLAHDVRCKLPSLPAAAVRRVGRPRLGRVLWLVPLALLLVLAFLFTDLLSPPWRGVLGGRTTPSDARLPEPQAVADRMIAEVEAMARDPLRGVAALPRLDDGDRLVATLTFATDADGAPLAPDHERSGNVPVDGGWGLARRVRVQRIQGPDYRGCHVTVFVFAYEAGSGYRERAQASALFDEPSGPSGNDGKSESRQPRPQPQPEPQGANPPPEPDEPQQPPVASTPPPLLDLPAHNQFLIPEFLGDGPTRRVRMHAAEAGDAPEAPGAQGGSAATTTPAPPARETFERAAEAAQRARHVPPAERAIVRAFFDALREASR
ncbi:MAG: hypothetical protein JNK15_02840 [Planctomycetes bacterium]|nr:hypothetical protein [Planctomycetota bacterium]